MWKNAVEPDRPQMTIYHGACSLHGYTNTHSECVIHNCFSTAKMVARTKFNITLPVLFVPHKCMYMHDLWLYKGADKSLARPTTDIFCLMVRIFSLMLVLFYI